MTGLLALAFTAGVLAPVNPCGFALLPAYLTHTITERPNTSLLTRVMHATATGAALAIGFAITLAGAGLAISAGARPIITAAPWLGFGVGIVLVGLGVATLTGHGLRLNLPRFNLPATAGGPLRWALFGVGYASASLACTFGVLLAVIAQAQTTNRAGQLAVFTAYAAGSVALLIVLSVLTALTGAALTRYVQAAARHHTKITAALLVITGIYLALYWLPAATGRASTGRGLNSIDSWSAHTATWLQTHPGAISVAALIAVTVTAGAATLHRKQAQRHAD